MARSVKRVSLPSSASLFRAHGGISALFRCRFSAADFRSGPMLFPADFFWDLRVRARMGNCGHFPDLTRGSLFPGCNLTFSAAIFTRIFPFGPFRAGMGHLHGMPAAAAAWNEATREPTPAPQTVTRSTPGTADRRQRAPHRENVTRSRSRRRTTPGSPAALILGKCTQEARKPRRSRSKPAFIVSPSHVPPAAASAAEGHTRGLTSGTVARLYRYYSGDATRGQCSTGATGANSGEATQPTRTAAHQEPQKAHRRPAAAFISFTW